MNSDRTYHKIRRTETASTAQSLYEKIKSKSHYAIICHMFSNKVIKLHKLSLYIIRMYMYIISKLHASYNNYTVNKYKYVKSLHSFAAIKSKCDIILYRVLFTRKAHRWSAIKCPLNQLYYVPVKTDYVNTKSNQNRVHKNCRRVCNPLTGSSSFLNVNLNFPKYIIV